MPETLFKVDKGICAPCALKNKSQSKFKTCYSKESLIKIANIWNKHNSKDKKKIDTNNKTVKTLWNQIHNKFKATCNKNEVCWRRQPIIKKEKDPEISMYTFKPDFPKVWRKNINTWLNTYDIYYIMKQYEQIYDDFVFLGPVPSDCPVGIHCELSKLNLQKMKEKNIHKIGIVYNLDISTRDGSHWVAMYIDNKNNEINYYDSYGSLPTPLIHKFIQKLVEQYKEINIIPIVIFNDKRHQYKTSECGMFSINFILERINGKTMYDFHTKKITDDDMLYLRNILYNKK